MDRYVPEFETYLEGELIDYYLIPSFGRRYRWARANTRFRRVPFTDLFRSVYMWWMKWRHGTKLAPGFLEMKTAQWIAERYTSLLPKDTQRLIVLQDFLPFLWQMGVLKGREFEVLLTRPPLETIDDKLSMARKLLPQSISLVRFHAGEDLIRAESEALAAADRVITPHEEYAELFKNVRKLEWELPSNVVQPAAVRQPKYLLFPADLCAREGAHAALAVAEFLEMPLIVLGENIEGLAMSSDLVQFIGRGEIPWHEIAAVVHPALFTSWPRTHLYARALGIPVITTESCGLQENDGVYWVPFADEEALRKTLNRALAREIDITIEPHHLPRQYSGTAQSRFTMGSQN